MQAVILAAGMGKRLKELTQNNTKCMVKVNGVTLIDRMLHQLDRQSLKRIVIVVGYEGKKLQDYIAGLDIQTPIEFIENPIYDKTNNIYSLALAKEALGEDDTLLLESDLIFEDGILEDLLADPRDTLALVDKYESWMDGTCVKLAGDDTIEAFVPGKRFKFNEIKEYYKTVNIYKFGKSFSNTHYIPFLEAYQKALGTNEYYEQVLRIITMLDDPGIKAKRLTGKLWYEIDDIQDLDIAASIFAQKEKEKAALLQKRFGGYWRYPALLDFCYLVNPYFPPQRLMDEMKASFETLLCQYPSGMRVNSLLAGKNFGISQENIAVGNGAAELIKSLMEHCTGPVGFIRPAFEEYPNRLAETKRVCMEVTGPDFSYTAQDVKSFFEDKELEALVLVNPDNPTGHYLCRQDLMELIEWARAKNIEIVIDESFADFAQEEDPSLIHQDLLDANPHLVVVKSISKSYGVPGLRLGVVCSGNRERIAAVKKDVSIWNINSFAEFYMQIEEKYHKEYEASLKRLQQERTRFSKELAGLKGLRVLPSQANYIMVELTGQKKAEDITEQLLSRFNILVKDLSQKIPQGQYLRLAVRNEEDNSRLTEALRILLA